MDLAPVFLSARCRISLTTVWLGAGLLAGWGIVVFALLWTVLGPRLVQNFFGRMAGLPFTLLTVYFAYNLVAKRCNDRERPLIFAQAVAGVATLKSLTDLVRITGGQHANWLD